LIDSCKGLNDSSLSHAGTPHIRKKNLRSKEKKCKIEIFLEKRISNALLKLESFAQFGKIAYICPTISALGIVRNRIRMISKISRMCPIEERK
jgi:hypothetical protein